MPKGLEAFTIGRPDEEISTMFAPGAVLSRMVPSVLLTMFTNKTLVELKRKLKEIYAKDNPSILKEDYLPIEQYSSVEESITMDRSEYIINNIKTESDIYDVCDDDDGLDELRCAVNKIMRDGTKESKEIIVNSEILIPFVDDVFKYFNDENIEMNKSEEVTGETRYFNSEDVEIYKPENIVEEGLLPQMTFYHGTPLKINSIKPSSPMMGNRLSDPDWVSYLWRDKKMAELFSVQKKCRYVLSEIDSEMKKPVYDVKTGKSFLLKDDYDKIRDLIINKETYVYETKSNITDMNIGHSKSINEFTTNMELDIYKKYTIKITENIFNNSFIKISKEDLYKETENYKKNNRGMLGFFMYDQEELFCNEKLIKKGLKSGAIVIGDDIVDYLNKNSTVKEEYRFAFESFVSSNTFYKKAKEFHKDIFEGLYPGEVESFTDKNHSGILFYNKKKEKIGFIIGCEFRDKELGKDTITILIGVEERQRGKGYAMMMCRKYFEDLIKIKGEDIVIRWKVDKRNKASIALATKLGLLNQYLTEEDIVMTNTLGNVIGNTQLALVDKNVKCLQVNELSDNEPIKESNNSISINMNKFISEKDIYVNFDKWENGKSNVLFVTGISGSGKSVLAKKIAGKYDAEYIDLDKFRGNKHYSDKELMDLQPILFKYLNNNFKNRMDIVSLSKDKYNEAFDEYINWLINSDQRVVIEGVQVAQFVYENKKFVDYPIVFKGTSKYKSMFRRFQRDGIKNTFTDIIKTLSLYNRWENEQNIARQITIKKNNNFEKDGNGTFNNEISLDNINFKSFSDKKIPLINIEGKPYLMRVEGLVMKSGKLFLQSINKINQYGVKYRLPGGSLEDGMKPEDVINMECKQEAGFSVKDITNSGLYYITDYNGRYPKWQVEKLHPSGIKYEGTVTFVFTADYDKEFNGEVDDIDKDEDMKKFGRFYNIDKIKRELSVVHKEVLKV